MFATLSTTLLATCLVLAAATGVHAQAAPDAVPAGLDLITGVVWQPHQGNAQPKGSWHRLGATALLVQWTVVDGMAYIRLPSNTSAPVSVPPAAQQPDWIDIGGHAWAQHVTLGLVGQFDEATARAHVDALVQASISWAQEVHSNPPLPVTDWYFPVELDPSWTPPTHLKTLLTLLPRPLWVSVYDNTNQGPDALLRYLEGWLPDDVGVYFQDGVGVHTRNAVTARQHADALVQRLGAHRVRLIAEAFRPASPAESASTSPAPTATLAPASTLPGSAADATTPTDASGLTTATAAVSAFRPATAAELKPQLMAYRGLSIYLFEGPTYVPDATVEQLLQP